jgi:LmbE family N-acetylglucosaminyl deacetylase
VGRVAGDRETGAALSDTVLAVLTHPDDCEIACGGTLAKWAGEGRTVTIAVLTDGRRGSQNPTEDIEALILTRRREQEAGANVMGARDVRFFDYRDGELENTPDVRRDVVRLIRELHPTIVITVDPSAWFFGDEKFSYYNHRDHRMSGEIVLDAVAPAAGNPHFFPEHLAEGLKVWDVPEVWLAHTLEPNHTEDISGFVDVKLAALEAHRSQLTDDQLAFFKQWMPTAAADSGKKIGVEAGEDYRVLRFG